MAVAGLKDTVSDLFSGNPFATEVGHRIEQASDPKLGAENWGLFMEICDLINENEEAAKDAARAIKKRLNVVMQSKDFEAAQLLLTILETCVKNCGKRFHAIICSKEYASELVKLIGVRYEPPVMVQERVLGLIQSWAETFRSSPDLHGITEVYDDLKSKGVEFPVLDLDSMAPILTPQKSATAASQPPPPPPPSSVRRTSLNATQSLQQPQHQQQIHDPVSHAMMGGMGHGHAGGPVPAVPVSLTPEQLAKLRGEVDIVKSNMQVFTDMIGEMKPGQEEQEDLQLLMDLHTTIRSMQDRVVQLLGVISNEEVTGELLAVNDEMNSVFMRYERYERQRKGAAIQSRALPQPPPGLHPEPDRLLDLSDTSRMQENRIDNVQRQLGSLSLDRKSSQPEPRHGDLNDSDTEDFGAFALSRVAQPAAGLPVAEIPAENELVEMEKWLKSQPTATTLPSQASDRPTLTSSEFDRFLESRAVAGEQLPNIHANRGSNETAKTKGEDAHLLDF